MADIKRLLNKKSWSGQELGILELTNMCVMFRQSLEGKYPQPIVTQAKLNKMINTLNYQQELIYNGYISIHEWLSIRYNIAQTHLQHAQLRYRELAGYMALATLAEDVYHYIEQLPIIMTQKQYEDTKAGDDISVFDGNKRALCNGIAILQTNKLIDHSTHIDERGYYAEPDIQYTISDFTLESFFPEAESYADNIDIVESARQNLIESYYYLKGYNLALKLIGRFYDVPEMTVFRMNIVRIEDDIQAFNELVTILCKKITDTDYANGELKAKKLQVLKDFFQPINYEAIAIPAGNVEQAEKLLKDFAAFKPENKNRFNTLLCVLSEKTDEN